ncbi:MAG TPA: hypothetical protein VII51_00960, partial [Gaiellaceae bacterium]
MAVPYASGFAAFRQPSFVSPSPALPLVGIPLVRFPGLAVPKLRRPTVVPHTVGNSAPTLGAPKHSISNATRRTHVPVVTDMHALPTAASPTSTKKTVDPFAKAPVVDDSVGAVPPAPPAPPAATAPASVPTTPAAPASSTTGPAAATTAPAPPGTGTPAATDPSQGGSGATPTYAHVARRVLAAVATTSAVDQIQADSPPVTLDDTVGAPPPSQIEAPPSAPASSGDAPVQSPENVGIASPPSLAAPSAPDEGEATVGAPLNDLDGLSGTPPVPTPTDVVLTQPSVAPADSTPSASVPGSTQSAAPTAGSSSGASAPPTTYDSSIPAGAAGTGDASDTTTPAGEPLPPPDPAATPGSGPSPPGLITPDEGGTASTTDGSASVAFAPGLVSNSTVVSVVATDAAVPGFVAASPVYDLTATDTSNGAVISHFSGTPVLTISYDPTKPTPTAIYYLDPVNGPVALASTVDTADHTISAALPHFSAYAALSPADLALSLSPQIVQTSSSTTITATVTQGGGFGVSGATVDFSPPGGSAAFGSGLSSCLTDVNGTCTVTISDTAVEAITVSASVEEATPPATATATILFVPFNTSSLGTGQQSVSLGGFLQFSGAVEVESHGQVSAKLDNGSAISDISLYTVSLTGGSLFAGANAGTSSAAGLQGTISTLVAAFFFHGTDSWQAVSSTIGSVSVIGIPDLTLTATGASVSYNGTSGGHALDLTQVDPNNGTTYGTLDVDSVSFDGFDTSQAKVHADTAQVGVGSFVSAQGTVDLTQSDVQLTTPSVNGGAAASASLLDVAVTGASLTVGAGGTGFSASSTSLEVAIVKPQTTGTDETSFVGAQGSIGSADLTGASDLFLHVAGASFQVNGATDSTGASSSSRLDWSTALSGSHLPGLTMGSDVIERVTGAAAVSVSSVLDATTSNLTLDHSTVTAGDDGHGVDLAGADVWAFGLDGADVFVGTGGSLASSGSASGYDVSPGPVGIHATVTSLELARISKGGTTYDGVQVDGLTGSVLGIPSVQLELKDGHALANVSSSGTKLDFAGLGSGVLPFPIGASGTTSLELGGAAALSIAGVVVATGTFTVDHTTGVSGSDGNGVTLSGADVWAFGATGASVFVGTGGSLTPSGSASGFDVVPGSPGVSGSVSSLSVAQISASGTTYVGVEADGIVVDLVGVPGVTLHASSGSVLSNSSSSGSKLNFAGLTSAVLPFTIAATENTALHVSGSAALSIAGVVVATGTFSIDHTTGVSGSDGNGVTLSGVDVWAFGATGATVFVGSGGSLSTGYAVVPGSPGVSGSATTLDVAQISSSGPTYTGVQAAGVSADLVGVPALTLHVEGGSVLANTSSSATKLNFAGLTSGVLPFTIAATQTTALHLSGAVAVAVTDVVAATADNVTLDHSTGVSGSDGNGITLAGADVWALSLTSPSVFVGVGGSLSPSTSATSHFVVGDGTFGVSGTVTSVKLAQIAQGGATYTGVEVDGLTGDLVGLVGLTVHVAGVTALANLVSGSTTKLNWAGLDSDVLPFSFATGLTRSVSLHLSGALALSIGTFLAATTDSFTLDHTTASGSDNASSSPITLTGADVWAFSLGRSHVFVGLGAALTPDSGAASGYDVTDGTVGVAATISGLQVATITQGPATYTGVEADGIGGSFTGIDPVTLTVIGVTALYNASSTATKLNWAGLDSGILPYQFDSTLTRNLSFHLAGSATVSFDSFVTGSAGFAVTESDVDVTTPALTGASLLVISLTSPILQIGLGSFGLSLGGAGSSVTIASLTPGTPDGRSWTAVQATGLTGSLTIGTLATATLTGVSIDLNSASGTGATPLDWNGVDGSGITLTGSTAFTVAGTLNNLAIAGFVSGSATFTVSESTINVTVGGVDLTGATLLTLGLGSLNLNVGSASGPHFSVTGGSLAIAALSAPAPSAGTDTRSWLGVIGSITSASLVSGIPDVSLTVDGLTLRLNQASGAYTNGTTVAAAPLDWTTALDLNTDSSYGTPQDQLTVGGIPIDLTAGTLSVSGTANVQLFGMISGEVSFAFQQQTVSVDVDRDGTLELPVSGTAWARGPPGPDLQNATLTTFGLSVAAGHNLSFGVAGVGFTVSAGSLALAIVTPSASAQAAGDGRSWLALDAQITAASFTGIPGLTLTVTGLTVEINRASGVYTDPTSQAAVSTQALNWTKSLDLDGDGVFGENPTDNPGHNDQLVVPIGGGGTVPIAFTGTTSLKVTGTATISFDSLISGTVGFALATQTITGTDIGGVNGLSSASLTTLAITATSLFVGWGTVGFQLTGGGLAIASLAPSTSDGRSWLGIQADLSSGSLMGVPGLTLSVSALQVSLNSASGTGATPLDWTKVQTGGVAILDANGVTHTIATTGATPLVVSGNATVDVAGLLGGSAHFVITQSTVDVSSVGLTGATLLTITLSNLQLAVGTTSIGAQIGGPDSTLTIGLLEPAASTDTRRWFGLSSSGITASLVLPSVTATVSNLSISVNEATGGAVPLDWTTVPGNPLGTLSGAQLSADGDLTDLSIFGILSGSAHVSFARQTVDVELGSSTFLTGATLLSFSLSLGGGETLQAGVTGFGLTITDGTLLIAAIAPAASSDGRRWIAVQGTGLAATLAIPDITATVSSVGVSFNGATGGASAIDWMTDVGSYDAVHATFTAAPVEVATGGGSTQVTLTSPILTLSGHLSLTIGSFLSISADFVLTRSTIALDLNGDGTADITGATLLTLALSGVGGTLGAAGGPNIVISGGSLALASISAPGASATWTALEGTISGATLNGVPGLTFTASSLTLDVNSSSGTYGSSVAAPSLNWATMLDLNRNGNFGESADQLVVGTTPINLNGAQVAATGTAHVNLFGFVDGTVSFSFQQQQVSVDVDGDGSIETVDGSGNPIRGPPGPDLVNATLTTLGLAIPVGQSLTIGAGGVGFTVSSGTLAVAVITTGSATDTRSWSAVTAQIAQGTFAGIPGVSLTVTSLGLQINRPSGSFTNGATTVAAQPLDWTKDVGSGTGTSFVHAPVTITTPTPTRPVTQTISYTTGAFSVTGSATVDLFGFVSGTVGFALTTTSVTATAGGPSFAASLTTIAITTTNLFVGAGGVGFQIGSGGAAVAFLKPIDTSDARSWTALSASLANATFTGVPGVSLTVDSLSVSYNTGTPGPLDWASAFTTPLVITDANGGTHPIDFSASTPLQVTGTATVDLFDVVSGTVGFSLTKQDVSNVSVGGGPPLASGTLTTIGLTVSNLFLGVGAIGFTLTQGSVTVAILSPTATTDTRRWTAVSAQLGGAALNGIPGITLTATELDVDVNQASTGATPLNWATAFGGLITPPVTFSGPLLEIAATASLSIGSFVYASGSFVIESGGDIYVTPTAATGTVHVSLLEIGVSNATVFAGVGASDSSGAGGVGVALSGGLGLALMSEIGGSGRSYFALSASGTASLIGVPGITLVGSVQVQVDSASTGNAVDFTQLTAGKLSIPTAPGSGAPTVDLAFTGTLLQVTGSLTLSIDGFASVSGNFAFQQGGTVSVTTEGGGSGTATALEIGASNASAFFGVGADNPTGPGAMGLSITGVTFGLALLKATAPINGATSFVALKASGSVALVGITGITASMTNAAVSVNEAYDAGGNVIAQAVNFTGHNLSIPTGGTGTTPVTLDFAGSTFSATGTIAISIGSFVYVSGSVAFGKGTALSGVPLAGSSATPNLSVLTIGASNADIFVGVGATDSTGAGGIGLALTGVTFGLALLKPADGSAGSYYALKATAASVGLVGVPGVTISATGLEVDVNGSDTTGTAVDFTGLDFSVPTGGSGSTPVAI